MVDVKTRMPRRGQSGLTPGKALPQSARLQRLERIRAGMEPQRARVEPRDEDMRRLLKHPNGMGFRSKGSVEWPMDKFTKRRLADGSIKLAEPEKTGSHPASHPMPPAT